MLKGYQKATRDHNQSQIKELLPPQAVAEPVNSIGGGSVHVEFDVKPVAVIMSVESIEANFHENNDVSSCSVDEVVLDFSIAIMF